MNNPGKIFLGACPSGNRRFIRGALERLHKRYPKLVVPAVGTFGIVKAALEAGYRPEDIEASDICVFSCVLGWLYSGQPLSTLEFELSESWRQHYDVLTSEIERAAFLLWLMKLKQFRQDRYFEQQYAAELIGQSQRYRDGIAEELKEYAARYRGIRYGITDLRDVVRQAEDPETLVVMDPPIYPKGYTKMFTTAPDLVFSPPVEEFDYPKELTRLYERSKEKPALFLWGIYTETDLPRADCIFACELPKAKFTYWYCTKRADVEALGIGPTVEYRPRPKEPVPYEIVPYNMEVTAETKVGVREVDRDVALYYRDLFAHKLGATSGESFTAILLDGRVFGIVGWIWGDVLRGRDRHILEVFGFNAPLAGYPKANRLLMHLITCRDMRDHLLVARNKRNRTFSLDGVKTACLSKYRKVKTNNGILRLDKRERYKSNMYKLLYVTEWHDRSFADCLRLYLEELETSTCPTP